MRPSFPLVLLICLFCSVSLFSQNNEAAIDLRIAPGGDHLNYGASLNYFRKFSPQRSIGGKVTVLTDPLEEMQEGVRHLLIVTDFVTRWKLSKGDLVFINVEMGISTLLDVKRTLPYTMRSYFCGVGLTQAQIEKSDREYMYGKIEKNLLWGPAFGASLHFRISPMLSIGPSAFFNWYYAPKEDVLYSYFSPALRTSFYF